MNNEQLIKNTDAIEKLRQQVINDLYIWFDNNQKDNKICIAGKLLIFYYYKKNNMLYQEDSDGLVDEIDAFSIDELYSMMKMIINAQ